jgi:phosphoribosylanthranilate isomerase
LTVVQIFSMTSVADALSVSEAGADHVGCMVSTEPLPFSVSVQLGREICDSVRPSSKSVVIPLSHDPAEIIRIVTMAEPDIVQLANDESLLGREPSSELLLELSKMGFNTIRVIPIGKGYEVAAALDYQGKADMIMLDSDGPPPSKKLYGFIGGTGLTHDWKLSARIVRMVRSPVILAGGLNLNNVAEAVEEVKPWGVDAASSLDLPGTRGKKDIDKVRRFVRLAKGLD